LALALSGEFMRRKVLSVSLLVFGGGTYEANGVEHWVVYLWCFAWFE